MFHSIPAQLAKNFKRFRISTAVGSKKYTTDEERIYDLIDSRTVLVSYNSTDPRVSLSSTKDLGSYKLYIADTGLFVTLMFMDRPSVQNELYKKLMSDKLPANLGYLYENVVAQLLAASGRELYYHTWKKKNSTHYYEVDFLISQGVKVSALEVKSSGMGKHESLYEFKRLYAKHIRDLIILSQKDKQTKDGIRYIPLYLTELL